MNITRGALAQAFLVVVGLWLMAAPAVFGHSGENLGESDRIAGPAIVSAAFLAIFTITRLVRWFNLIPGAWLLIAPFVFDAGTAATVNDVVCGLVVLALAPIEKADQSRYAGGWATLLPSHEVPGGPSSS